MRIFPKNIYKYSKNSGVIGLCVYICDTDNSNEIIVGCIEDIDPLNEDYIRMANGLKKVLYLDRYLTLKTDSLIESLYLNGKQAIINSLEFQQLTSSIYKLIVLKYEKSIETIANNNFDKNNLIDISLPEKILKLLTWNATKLSISKKEYNPNLTIIKYGIYFAYMGTNVGSETNKLRPVLVWKKHENNNNHNNDLYYIFPLSSKLSGLKYNYNVQLDVNGKQNKLMINQGRVLSRKRFVKILEDTSTKKVYKLSNIQITEIEEKIQNYFSIKSNKKSI